MGSGSSLPHSVGGQEEQERCKVSEEDVSAVFENLKEEYKARVNALREKYVGKSIQEGALRRSLLELYLKHEKGSQAKSQESQKRATQLVIQIIQDSFIIAHLKLNLVAG